MNKELSERFKKIKVLALDFDGVLTDGYVYVDALGNESVRCSHRDGMGVQLLRKTGLLVCVFTNQESNYVISRCNKMGIKYYKTRGNKTEIIRLVLKKYRPEEICYVGDDVNDIDAMNYVGLSVAVADAEEAVKQVATHVTLKAGGRGAVREVCDILIKAYEKSDILS